MKVHEHQARDILSAAGVPVPEGAVATTVEEAVSAAQAVFAAGGQLVVIKAQVHAGGRGKAGFVKLVKTQDEAQEAANFMLSNRMVSPQTGAEGLEVKKLLVAEAVDIAKEYYLAVTHDRARRCEVLIASAEGGVEIEQVAEDNPEAILKHPIDPLRGLEGHEARTLAFKLGFKGKQVNQAAAIMSRLVKCFRERDCSLAEINPLVVTPPCENHPDGQVLAIDAKFNFDDNASSAKRRSRPCLIPPKRSGGNPGQRVWPVLRESGRQHRMPRQWCRFGHGHHGHHCPPRRHARQLLGCWRKRHEEAVAEAFRIILSDETVQGVLVNIFGGIMQCDKIARAIVAAAGEVGFSVPLVVRLEGTNVGAAREVLEAAKADIPNMQVATDLEDAAAKVCAAVA